MSSSATQSAIPTSRLDRWFEISARGSTIGREVRGGLVTFFTMAYIIALNPLIIGTAADVNGNLITGLPKTAENIGGSIAAVAAATALIAGIMTIAMGVVGRFPLGLATGLGLNALLAFGIVRTMTWPQAMGLVVWEGILIAILVLTGFRQAVFRAVPRPLRIGIAVGLGLFIAFVGLFDAGIVRKPQGTPPVEFGINGSLLGWPMLVFVIGLVLVAVLYARKVRGALLISILVSTVLAIILEAVVGIGSMTDASGKVVNPTGWMLNVPAITDLFTLPDLSLLGRVDLFGMFTAANGFGGVLLVLLTIFSLLLADFFDTMGTVVAVGAEGGLLDAEGNPPHITGILLVDSLGAVAGGLGSVSSNTTYIESAAGVGEGSRTGLASVVTGIAFLASVFLAPIVDVVPSEAATPVLVFVGFLMMAQVGGVEWDDVEQGLPAFLTLALMPFTYSISIGIGAGFITFVLLKVARGKARQVHPLMYLVAALFVIYFAQGLIGKLVG
ncbi:permease [Enemella evansiae]|uniref:NCS2 family permease n=1 Tax=Enemella evansiae TaxID=2016499 RepID=UPI000B9639EE|nr:NCS2 family permease [Enemella evansiae]OYO07744.1 permease [Enemella evansiae]